ncbi:hypothetical protein M3Y99_00568500 [Aphelenchoides fujianensis]|nr:hypothetical protein M3Y99_00568500 [Aphelenchoides fujianensis]
MLASSRQLALGLMRGKQALGAATRAASIMAARKPCVDENWEVHPQREGVRVEVATVNERNQLLDFFLREFSAREPICEQLGVTESELAEFAEWRVDKALKLPYTMLAYDEDELCGVLVNTIKQNDRSKIQFPPQGDVHKGDDKTYSTRRMDYWGTLLDRVESMSPYFLPREVQHVLHIEMGTVLKRVEQKGVLKKMLVKTAKEATRDGLEYADSVVTARGSTGACVRVGMNKPFFISYRNVIDQGKPIFTRPMIDGCTEISLVVGSLKTMAKAQV